MQIGRLVSIQVGQPRWHGVPGAAERIDQPWRSAFCKQAVEGKVHAGRTNIVGDAQADRVHHGGADKAVLAYAAAHYQAWREELAAPDFAHGAFGENLTVWPWTEQDTCIGDVLAVGPARMQVSQPRQPCWKLSRRWRIADLHRRVIANGRSGWYLRVLEEGIIEAGLAMELVERHFPQWTIARANQVLYGRPPDREAMVQLADCPLLSESWRSDLAGRAAQAAD